MDTGVTVVGSGQVSGAPDLLRVTFGVEQAEVDVAAAVATVGERTDAVIAALRAHGVEQLSTSTVSVYQDYREPSAGPVGFRASHTLQLETADLTGFGALLSAAVDAAGNSLTLQGLQFDIRDKSELLTRARELAFQQARTKAEHLAALAGYELGAVTGIAETQRNVPLVELHSAKAYDSALTITPGEHSVQIALEVQFAWA